MKKIVCVICTVLAFTVMSVVCAEAKTYRLDETGITMSVPEKYSAMTRDIQEDEPLLELFGATKEEMVAIMEDEEINLFVTDSNHETDITVSVLDGAGEDWKTYSDEEWQASLEDAKAEYSDSEGTLLKADIYDNGKMKYLRIYTELQEDYGTIQGIQYITGYGGNYIDIIAYYLNMDSEDEENLRKMVDSITFPANTGNIAESNTANGFKYTDEKVGLTFIVPPGYIQEEASGDVLKMNFRSIEDETVFLMYTYEDLWGEVPAILKPFVTRSDMDLSMMTEEEWGEELGVDSLEKVKCGGKVYYKNIYKETDDAEIEITQLFCVENGYIYIFQTNAGENSKYYKDLEALVGSAEYAEVGIVEKGSARLIQILITILLNIILTIAVYSLPIIILRYLLFRRPVKPSVAKVITFVYAIIAFFVVVWIKVQTGSVSARTAIIFWSAMNYRMLTGGKDVCSDQERDYNGPDVTYKHRSYNKEFRDYEGPYVAEGNRSYNMADAGSSVIETKEQVKKISFYHECQRCGYKFKVEYGLPAYKKEIPELNVVCPKCKIRLNIGTDEIKQKNVL